jgi:hypothetical protein
MKKERWCEWIKGQKHEVIFRLLNDHVLDSELSEHLAFCKTCPDVFDEFMNHEHALYVAELTPDEFAEEEAKTKARIAKPTPQLVRLLFQDLNSDQLMRLSFKKVNRLLTEKGFDPIPKEVFFLFLVKAAVYADEIEKAKSERAQRPAPCEHDPCVHHQFCPECGDKNPQGYIDDPLCDGTAEEHAIITGSEFFSLFPEWQFCPHCGLPFKTD